MQRCRYNELLSRSSYEGQEMFQWRQTITGAESRLYQLQLNMICRSLMLYSFVMILLNRMGLFLIDSILQLYSR